MRAQKIISSNFHPARPDRRIGTALQVVPAQHSVLDRKEPSVQRVAQRSQNEDHGPLTAVSLLRCKKSDREAGIDPKCDDECTLSGTQIKSPAKLSRGFIFRPLGAGFVTEGDVFRLLIPACR